MCIPCCFIVSTAEVALIERCVSPCCALHCVGRELGNNHLGLQSDGSHVSSSRFVEFEIRDAARIYCSSTALNTNTCTLMDLERFSLCHWHAATVTLSEFSRSAVFVALRSSLRLQIRSIFALGTAGIQRCHLPVRTAGGTSQLSSAAIECARRNQDSWQCLFGSGGERAVSSPARQVLRGLLFPNESGTANHGACLRCEFTLR